MTPHDYAMAVKLLFGVLKQSAKRAFVLLFNLALQHCNCLLPIQWVIIRNIKGERDNKDHHSPFKGYIHRLPLLGIVMLHSACKRMPNPHASGSRLDKNTLLEQGAEL